MSYEPLTNRDSSVAVTEAEAMQLNAWAQEMESIVEVGSFQGYSSHALLSGCKGTVYCVDHFQGSRDPKDSSCTRSGKVQFLESCGGFPNLVLMEESSLTASRRFAPKSIDMVFIDAGHLYEEVLQDLFSWAPVATKLICGHDAHLLGVYAALKDFFKTFSVVPDTTLWEVRICEA